MQPRKRTRSRTKFARDKVKTKGKQEENEQDHTELLSLRFVRRKVSEPNIFVNLEENYIDYMNMCMIRNKNMDQSWLKETGKQLVPLFGLIAATLLKLEEKFYFVFYKINEWSLGPGHAPEYSVEKFHTVIKEFMLQRAVGCVLFGCTALATRNDYLGHSFLHGSYKHFVQSKFEEKKSFKEEEECCSSMQENAQSIIAHSMPVQQPTGCIINRTGKTSITAAVATNSSTSPGTSKVITALDFIRITNSD